MRQSPLVAQTLNSGAFEVLPERILIEFPNTYSYFPINSPLQNASSVLLLNGFVSDCEEKCSLGFARFLVYFGRKRLPQGAKGGLLICPQGLSVQNHLTGGGATQSRARS